MKLVLLDVDAQGAMARLGIFPSFSMPARRPESQKRHLA